MKAVIQRVHFAKVHVNGSIIAQINKGLLTLLGIAKNDTEDQLLQLIKKISSLRVFEDEHGKMNLSIKDISGAHLIVSQFTLLADCSQGRRPSFLNAEEPERAKLLYEKALKLSQQEGVITCGGQFKADMKIELLNDGPATFILESD